MNRVAPNARSADAPVRKRQWFHTPKPRPLTQTASTKVFAKAVQVRMSEVAFAAIVGPDLRRALTIWT